MRELIKRLSEEIIDIQTDFKQETIRVLNTVSSFDAATQTNTYTTTLDVTIPALYRSGNKSMVEVDGDKTAVSYFIVKKSDISFTLKPEYTIYFGSKKFRIKEIATDALETMLRIYVYDI